MKRKTKHTTKKSRASKSRNSLARLMTPTMRKRGLVDYRSFGIGKRTVHYIGNRVIIFRLMRNLHGRFWGVAGLIIMALFFVVCFLIRPDMLVWQTALSDFGRDVRTSPYLAAALFFGAYGLWRWRNYLRRTLRHSRPVTGLVTLTVLGLSIAALFTVAWEPWSFRIHMFGVSLFGISMAATVVVDTALTKTRKKKGVRLWRFLRLISFILILVGGYITFGSTNMVNWFSLALLGESMMFVGYAIWIIDKTYRGEGGRSKLSRLFRGLVLID